MATANFCKGNAHDYYVLESDETCDSADLIAIIRGNLTADGHWNKPQRGKEWVRDDFGWSALVVVSREEWLELSHDCAINICTDILYRPGYYADGTLDWRVSVEDAHGCCFSEEVQEDDIPQVQMEAMQYLLECESTWGAGIIRMQRKNILGKIEKSLRAAFDSADDLCRKWCTGVYGISAVFSNGETVYSPV